MSTSDFTSQFKHFELFLFNFALKLTKNETKASDLVQDTAMRAFRYREKFQMGTNFKGWIATIMRNTFISQYRKEVKRRTVSEPIEALAYGIESKNIVANAGEMNMRLYELKRMLNEIGELYSVPFILHYRGYEYQEIAEQLEIPMGTVKSRIFTARRKMKEMLQKSYA